MLWTALHFPLFPLESFLPASTRSEPWAVSDGACVAVCNEQARARGIRPGTSLATACALAPALNHRQRDPAAETAALGHIAAWAVQFTPAVTLQPPRGLLLEVEGSLRLFGGIGKILEAIKRGVADMGYTVSVACAPTASAAWLLARGGAERVFAGSRAIREAIAPLPVRVLYCDVQTLETLSAIGARSLGDLLALPRDGVARRFGQSILDQLDRALGLLPEARAFFAAPPRFDAELELAASVASAEVLLFPAKRLLTQLAGYLAARCAGIQRFRLTLGHEDAPETVLEIGLATPSRDAARFVVLARERLAATTLAAPVTRVRLAAGEILTLAGDSGSLFPDRTSDAGDWARLVERLSARLGQEAVHGLAPRAEHRPERAWQATAPGAGAGQAARSPRPLWLLERPRPLDEVDSKPHYHDGPLALLAGPERIESGWWDGDDVKRDYFIAQTSDRATLWVYRDRRQPGGWFLHGIFG
jgi:protein ImuB